MGPLGGIKICLKICLKKSKITKTVRKDYYNHSYTKNTSSHYLVSTGIQGLVYIPLFAMPYEIV